MLKRLFLTTAISFAFILPSLPAVYAQQGNTAPPQATAGPTAATLVDGKVCRVLIDGKRTLVFKFSTMNAVGPMVHIYWTGSTAPYDRIEKGEAAEMVIREMNDFGLHAVTIVGGRLTFLHGLPGASFSFAVREDGRFIDGTGTNPQGHTGPLSGPCQS